MGVGFSFVRAYVPPLLVRVSSVCTWCLLCRCASIGVRGCVSLLLVHYVCCGMFRYVFVCVCVCVPMHMHLKAREQSFTGQFCHRLGLTIQLNEPPASLLECVLCRVQSVRWRHCCILCVYRMGSRINGK